jgi:putative DNA primase/helicase
MPEETRGATLRTGSAGERQPRPDGGMEPRVVTPSAALKAGWSIIPTGADKKPIITWKPLQTRQPTDVEFQKWCKLNPAAWAIVTGAASRRIALDFDGEQGRKTLELLGLRPHRRTPSGGFHVDFVHPGWHVPTLNSKTDGELKKRWPGLDIRGDGGYVCFTGRTARGEYQWLRDPEPDCFDILPEDLREFLRSRKPSAAPEQRTNGKPHALPANGRVDTERLIRAALERAGSEGRNNCGLWLATQLRDNDYSQSEAESAMRNYRGRVPDTNTKGEREPYTDGEMQATLRAAYSRPAREPWQPKATSGPARPVMAARQPDPEPSEPPNLLSGFDPEDVGNAQRLIAMRGPSLRYCHAFNKWLAWDSRRWEVDESDRVRELTHRTMTEFALQAVKANNEALTKFAAGCRRAARITNAMREAQPYLAIKPADLDTYPDLLNFMNGTLDLKIERLMPHNPQHFLTKLVHYDYRPEATCPIFHAFLERITGGGPDASEAALERSHRLIQYLQTAFGYALTGHTISKAVFLLHGRGDNGKSTLLSTFLNLLEEYSVLLQIDTLMVRRESNNTLADLADLRGARFVMTSETEEGQRLAEGKLKRITQGMGRIKATRKYENPIEFSESHKLWIDANHLPIVRGTDNAIWNRLHPIPFDVTIPKDEQDHELPRKLMAEAEGILAWAVAGAGRWYAEGLGKPSDVEKAGESWREQSDHIGRFFQEICIIGEYAQAKARQLYQAYKVWAEETGEHPVTETAFGLRIDFPKKHTKAGWVYEGIGLKSDAEG